MSRENASNSPRGSISKKKRSVLCAIAELIAADGWAAVEVIRGGRPARRRTWLVAAAASGAINGPKPPHQVYESLHFVAIQIAETGNRRTLWPAGPQPRQLLLAEPLWVGVDGIWQAAGLADYLVSARFPDDGLESVIAFMRCAGRSTWTSEQVRLAEIVIRNTPWIHASDSLHPRSGAGSLTPRARETLAHVLAGRTNRGIAEAMGISTHTAGDYLKAIYRHFGVSGRGELFAQLAESAPSGDDAA